MIRLLRWLHLYGALVVAIPLALLFLSGIALVWKTDFWRWQHPELAGSPPGFSPEQHARAIETIRAGFDTPVGLIKLPQPELAAYQVWLADETEALVDPRTLEVVDRWAWWERPTAVLAEMHLHLFAGETGTAVIGWLGLALLFLLISGVIVWWPLKSLFRWRSLKPKDTSRGRMLMFHRNLGVVAAPLAFVLIAAGTGVAFFQPTRVLLNGLFGDAVQQPLVAPPQRESEAGSERPLSELMMRADRVLPEGRITFVYPDMGETGVLLVRKKMPGEAHPNGLSFIHLDRGSGRALRVIDASTAPPGDRVANWLYPLHAGKWNTDSSTGRAWQVVVAINGIVLVVMLVAGVIAWFRKPAPFRRSAARPARATPR
ncbi:MAG: PepSY-associated TM helix domain-containing protein [Candidatus Wenzhouxiangella sp. M2_3B_020]